MNKNITTKVQSKNVDSVQVLDHSLIQIFQKGSQTYFWSSVFFPKKIFKKVAILYAFVRLFDDFVDNLPQDKAGFDRFEAQYRKVLAERISENNKRLEVGSEDLKV